MGYIETLVIFDLETTGLPSMERNRTKITELCFIAVSTKDVKTTSYDELPPICKLSFVLNPEKRISERAASMTGLTNGVLKNAPTFKDKFDTIYSFLNDLKQPVCLVAHNGNAFDYKLLLAECNDIKKSLPADLLCVDSLSAFKKLDIDFILSKSKLADTSLDDMDSSILTDDEDDWPQLNITPKELQEIDELCSSFEKSMIADSAENKDRNKVKKNRESYKLINLYNTFHGESNEIIAHRAEGDCLMLLKCIIACQSRENLNSDFITWANNNCKKLTDVKPLERK